MRSLLVQAAHCILRKGAPDSDLRAWGLGKLASGGKHAKRRTVIAVARKPAVLPHKLRTNGEVCDPPCNRKAVEAAKAGAEAKAAA